IVVTVGARLPARPGAEQDELFDTRNGALNGALVGPEFGRRLTRQDLVDGSHDRTRLPLWFMTRKFYHRGGALVARLATVAGEARIGANFVSWHRGYVSIYITNRNPLASWSFIMSLPSNGITQDVIREVMPPYHLSPDLLDGTFRALPPPPPDAAASWRQARITRLVQEIGGLMPADAPQARIAAQIVVVREATDDTLARSYAPALTVEQVCRLRRTAADLARTAATLERGLTRRQAKPAPFFGTVLAAGVDIAALD